MENNHPPEEQNNPDTIFTENEFSNEGYDKHIRQARNTLFIIAGLQFIFGIYSIVATASSDTVKWVTFALTCFVALIFAALGFWTKKKPYTAIIIALAIYILLWIGDCIIDPSYIYRGILVKVIVFVFLVKGLGDAKEAQSMKKVIGNNV